MKKRTKHITLRLTSEEYAAITDKLPPHVSVSQYIRSALKEYSGNGAKVKITLMKELSGFYKDCEYQLSHISGNLNQAMKRVNELASAGVLSPMFMENLKTVIITAREALTRFRRKLEAITTRTTKP